MFNNTISRPQQITVNNITTVNSNNLPLHCVVSQLSVGEINNDYITVIENENNNGCEKEKKLFQTCGEKKGCTFEAYRFL